jgi:hypothetical protein
MTFALEAEIEIRGSALFARDLTLRREIRRWWAPKPIRWAAWLMLNPSNAGESANDPTALRVTHFTKSWGYDGWIGVNLYPFISSVPAAMWKWANWEAKRDDLGANLADIERVARLSSIRIAAFGAAPIEHDQPWLEQCLEAFGQPADDPDGDEILYCLGRNKTGQPLHPLARGKLRVPDDTRPRPWRE